VNWYAIHTRSRFEKRVCEVLRRKSLEAYLPVAQEVHRWKDRRKIVEVPVFPGYLFVRFPGCQVSRLAVLQTPGILEILGFGEQIEPIPESQIEAIRRLESSGLPLFHCPYLRQGALVRVRRGPLRGLEGILVRFKSRFRVVVSVTLLAQSVAAEVDASDLDAVQRPLRMPDPEPAWVAQSA
jgi:transcription antitermination factor NusG